MDCSHFTLAEDRDFSWTDSHSTPSDNDLPGSFPQSPGWPGSEAASATSILHSSIQTFSHHYRLPPVHTNHGYLASENMHVVSAVPRESAWGAEFGAAVDGSCADGAERDGWGQCPSEVVPVPKTEPADDKNIGLDDVTEVPPPPPPPRRASMDAAKLGYAKIKRPRGRPRKHPLMPIDTGKKMPKGRSKTGCLTCRKRKKKCDEAKPRCLNCEKNAVVCEGYPEKQVWKSGRERAEEEQMSAHTRPKITMHPLFHGLETIEDRIFWKHYNERLSTVLTVEGEHRNAFKDILIPLAVKQPGLMHSILSLSSKHIDYTTPYGANLLRKHPSTTLAALYERSHYHHEKALEALSADLARQQAAVGCVQEPDVLRAQHGQMLCFLLEAMAEGNPRGEHRFHLRAYQELVRHTTPESSAFDGFITELFHYHISADELIHYPEDDAPMQFQSHLSAEIWTVATSLHPPRLLGVADGLFSLMSEITWIRNTIRVNLQAGADPIVDYSCLYRAVVIDEGIKEWMPQWPPGDSRDRVSLLYKQMMWVYLYRTIRPPSPSSATSFLNPSPTSLPTLPTTTTDEQGHSSLVYTPPQSASPSIVSSPLLLDHQEQYTHGLCFSPLSRRNSRSETLLPPPIEPLVTGVCCQTPPPVRRPPEHDSRISDAVNDALAVLESINPSDPCQTLLLMPCTVIGMACFAPLERDRLRAAIRTVRGYTGMRNTDRVSQLLEEVWRLMDIGDWQAVWDWQAVARRMRIDFLCT